MPLLRAVVALGAEDVPGMLGGGEYGALAEDVGDGAVLDLHRRTSVREVALMMYTSGTTAHAEGLPALARALVRPASTSRDEFA